MRRAKFTSSHGQYLRIATFAHRGSKTEEKRYVKRSSRMTITKKRTTSLLNVTAFTVNFTTIFDDPMATMTFPLAILSKLAINQILRPLYNFIAIKKSIFSR